MRRTASALAVVGIVGALVLGAAFPANAAEPLPFPVTPSPAIPSQVAKSITGSPMGDVNVIDTLRALAAYRASGQTAPGTALVHVPKPITPPAPVARAVTGAQAGGALGAGFMAGWAITDGALALYGATTGDEPLGPACSLDGWMQGALSVLYAFSMPDCTATVTNANTDANGTPTLTTSAGVITYSHTVDLPNATYNYDLHCFKLVPTSQSVAPRSFGSPSSGSGGRVYHGSSISGSNSTSNQYSCASTGGPGYYFGTSTAQVSAAVINVYNVDTGVIVTPMTAPVSNPNRTPDCRLTWPDGSVTTATGSGYTEDGGINPRSISKVCNDAFVSKPGAGPDLLPSEIEVGSTPDGGTRSIMTEQAVPEYTPDEKKGLTTGNGRGLVLQKVVGTQLQSCMTWEADCAGWWEESANGTNPDTYKCSFGGEAIGLVECGIYRHTFDTQTNSPTVTDPATGTPQPWPSTNPNAAPGSATGNQTGGGGCGAGFSLNPVDWVMNPLKCLFIPSKASVDSFTSGIQGAADSTIIGSVARGASSLLGAFESGIGCGGLPIHLEAFGTVIVHAFLLESCSEPAAGVAATVKVVLTVGIVGAAFLAMIRYLAGIFGYGGLGSLMDNNDKHGGVKFD